MKVQAPIKVDRKTKRLAKRLTGREIAVINHVDIDEVAANSLVEGKIKLVINDYDVETVDKIEKAVRTAF